VRVFPRVVAALIAIVGYVVLWQLVGIAVLLVAWLFGLDVPGYHEATPAWWSWLWSLVFLVGLAAVLWWVVFRLPRSRWWRGRSRERRTAKEVG
jgi:hypothetical protein